MKVSKFYPGLLLLQQPPNQPKKNYTADPS